MYFNLKLVKIVLVKIYKSCLVRNQKKFKISFSPNVFFLVKSGIRSVLCFYSSVIIAAVFVMQGST